MDWSQLASGTLRSTQYQKKAQELNELINSLRTTGAQFVLDLPTVCVCGNQSAGKSSVMEGLSGITLPRSSGTCTRCPMEVRMASQGTFSCALKLRYEYDDSNGAKREGGVKEFVFGKRVTDEAQVELAIRRAQKAILNPSTSQATFEEYDFSQAGADTNELQFTKNVVVVEITGGPADLTLIDLPGIIRNTERAEDAKYIAMIQELVEGYVQKDNTIIVATVTCTDDIDNQEVVKMAKEADPDMVRTLGVLTKPDRIADGEEEQWLNILSGGRYALNLGWFAVKNPTQTQLDEGISFEQARELESEFFTSSPVWKAASHSGRLGTGPLRHSLSEQLVELIKQKLPGMVLAVQSSLDNVETELKKLPAPVRDPVIEYALLVNELHAELLSTSTAGPMCTAEGKAVYHKFRARFEQFQQIIIETQPVFEFQKMQQVQPAVFGDPCKFEATRLLVGCSADGSDLLCAKSEEELKTLRSASDTAVRAVKRRKKHFLSVTDVNAIIQEQAGAELPGTVPYGATLVFVQKFQADWAELAEECCSEVAEELLVCAEKKLEARLWRFPEMLRRIKALLADTYGPLSSSVLQQVQDLARDELQQPFTLNDHYLQDSKTKLTNRLLKVWRAQNNVPLNVEHKECLKNSVLQLQQVPGFQDRKTDDLYRTLDLFKDQQALELMATAMAYLKVAAKRFGDIVPMRISRALLHEFPGVLQQEMLKLMAVEGSRLPELLKEDGQMVARRTMLLSNQKCLKEARHKLSRFA